MERPYAQEKERLLRSLIRDGLTAVLLLAVVAVVTRQYAWIIVIATWTCGWCLWFIWRMKAASRPPAGSG